MARFIPALARRAVPRYTSYPTAADFSDAVGPAGQATALAAVPADMPVSLYVHIPYCRALCWYCGCNTGAAGQPERQARYASTLMREAQLVGSMMRGEVVSIHFGGGSPNALPAALFEQLVGHLRNCFATSEKPDIAVELDPRFLEREYCDALVRAGVTRVSLGVQTFAPDVQRRIGRIQPFWQVFEVVRDLRYAGIRHIALDLMYGLPGQTIDDVAETIEQAMRLQPDRIAMFGYAHLPTVLPRQRAIDACLLPDEAERFAQSELAFSALTSRGYSSIGFDHFARPDDSIAIAAAQGQLKRNFQGFTEDAGLAVIGLGASAISQFDHLLVQNEKHEAAYRKRIDHGRLAGYRGIVRTQEDRMRGEAIAALLCNGSVNLVDIANRGGSAADSFTPSLPALGELEQHGLLTREAWQLTLTEEGRPYARLAAAALDGRRGGAGTFSNAV
ncbi:oxygen-independent coproporphyrinogen III oxidase [Sphingomonas sp.]|uniref:oxygen-independent coproporphyrinogen III oxidase n=1 Tax=Sphingomonas sp. TaxID=28214 RepID=UPI003B3A81CD